MGSPGGDAAREEQRRGGGQCGMLQVKAAGKFWVGGGEVQDAPRFLCPLSRVSSPRMKGEQVDTIPPAAPCPAGEELSPSPGSEPQ